MSVSSSYSRARYREHVIFVIGDHLPTIELLCSACRIEGFHTKFSTSAPQFRNVFTTDRIDAVVVGETVGEEQGLSILGYVKRQRPIPVFMTLQEPNLQLGVAAMRLGAEDVFSAPIDIEFAINRIKEALAHSVQRLGPGGRRLEVRGFSHLTQRERQVLQLIANGHSNKEAALDLGISPRTVEVHRARVMEKMGARNTADLVRIVLTGDS